MTVDDFIDFEQLKDRSEPPVFDAAGLDIPLAPPQEASPQLDQPPPPSGLGKLIPGTKRKHEEAVARANESYRAATEAAKRAYAEALKDYEARETERERALEEARATHQQVVAERHTQIAAQHAEVENLRQRFDKGDPGAVSEYFSLVLQDSVYPEGFPTSFRLALIPESRQLVVEKEFPTLQVVPEHREYRYIKSKDAIVGSNRPVPERKALYASVIAQVTVRTLHELFEADRTRKIETIVLNGFVETIDSGTGKTISPHLVTVRTSRDRLEEIDLANVEPLACLKTMNAGVSRSPAELVPVRPILEFDMVDPRFVAEANVLSTLDQRPNLMELTPGEFESLITNLFERMGLETRLTQGSRDGGVDCVAYDPRPIFGGKVVIQAKRYKNTVGVSAVRDLFGTMQNEGASKGILVTTSGYGRAAFDFADGKPMELLSGSNLLTYYRNTLKSRRRSSRPKTGLIRFLILMHDAASAAADDGKIYSPV